MEDADLVLVLGDPDCEGATDQVVRVAAKCSTTGTTYLEGGRSGAGGASRWQRCRQLQNFERSPEFRSFQNIAQKIARNFCAIFKNAPKRFQMLPKCQKSSQK